MTLRRQLALRYAAIVALCLLLLGGLAHHEFIHEPRYRKAQGIPEPPETPWGEYVEVFFYGMIPVVLGLGWWAMHKTLAPIDTLAHGVERIQAHNLREPLPRTGRGDEVDRLTEAFNTMTARLDDAFQQIRTFTLHASHELKTPLTVMRADVETALAEGTTLPPAHRESLHSQLDEIDRLTKIVDSLTLLTKTDTGQVTLEWEPVWLAELVRECYEDAQILAEPANVHVSLPECADVVTLGDRHRLRQLLLNLTDNAIKYNRPGGTVTMVLRRAGAEAEIEIVNTGAGIPAGLLPRIFDRFVRGPTGEGCGLGLAIVQWIVHAHCGTIRISSVPGQTTTVTVRLPLADTNRPISS